MWGRELTFPLLGVYSLSYHQNWLQMFVCYNRSALRFYVFFFFDHVVSRLGDTCGTQKNVDLKQWSSNARGGEHSIQFLLQWARFAALARSTQAAKAEP